MIHRLLQLLAAPRVLAGCFLLCALPTGLGCALLSPIGMFPDELAHAARADGLRHGEIFGTRPPPGFPQLEVSQGVMVDNGIFAILFNREFIDAFPDRPVHEDERRAAEAARWAPGFNYFPSQMVEYFPVLYVPGALGLLAGQALGLRPLYTFYLGRLAMLCAYLAMGTAAVRLARFGNGLLLAILILPTAINLGSSYSQDGGLIAACGLAAALLTRAPPGFSLGWCGALALITAAVCAKTPYAPLLLLCLPPLLSRGVARRVLVIGMACAGPALWLWHMLHAGFMAYRRPAYHPGRLWPGSHDILFTQVIPRDNALVLLAHPLQIVLLPVTSFAAAWPQDWRLSLASLAYGMVQIRPWEYPCLAAALLAAALGSMLAPPKGCWRGWDAGFAGLVLFASFIAVEIAMYLTFTTVGYGMIIGVQARYFLPLLPFFIFLLPWAGRGLAGLPRPAAGWFNLPAVLLAAVNSIALPAYIFHLYRMAGP